MNQLIREKSYFRNLLNDRINRSLFIKQWGVIFIFLALIILIAIFNPAFFRITNVASILNTAAIIGFITLGETLVVLTKEFDLSVGNLLGLCTVGIAAMTIYTKNLNPTIASILVFLTPLIMGLVFGYINSIAVIRLKIPSFIATVGGMWIAKGLAYFILRGVPKPVNSFIKTMGRKSFFNLPLSFIVIALVLILFYLILKRTKLGTYIYSVGSNTYAASLSGVNSNSIKTFVFVMSGLMAGLSALFLAGWTGTGYPRISDGYELYALSGVALGGVSFSGGYGNVFTPFVGICILQILDKLMIWRGVSPFISNSLVGLILIISLYFQYRGARE